VGSAPGSRGFVDGDHARVGWQNCKVGGERGGKGKLVIRKTERIALVGIGPARCVAKEKKMQFGV